MSVEGMEADGGGGEYIFDCEALGTGIFGSFYE